jgi:hypothetical protein
MKKKSLPSQSLKVHVHVLKCTQMFLTCLQMQIIYLKKACTHFQIKFKKWHMRSHMVTQNKRKKTKKKTINIFLSSHLKKLFVTLIQHLLRWRPASPTLYQLSHSACKLNKWKFNLVDRFFLLSFFFKTTYKWAFESILSVQKIQLVYTIVFRSPKHISQ